MIIDIVGFEGAYAVGSDGEVWNTCGDTPWKLSKCFDKDGYHVVNLRHNGVFKNAKVHRLVAMAFITNRHNKSEVNHINGIKTDNWVENLEWVTKKENNDHAIRTGLKGNICGENNPMAKLSNIQRDEIIALRKSGRKLKEIASVYGIAFQHVSKLCS